MKLTINIPEDEIIEQARDIAADRIAKTILERYREGYEYRKVIKEIVREIIKSDIDNLSDRAVAAAAKSIENRGVKKLLEKMNNA